MDLLVVNFELDDDSPVLAWQARVVRELATRVHHLVVVSEKVGNFDPPANVEVIPIPRFMVGPPRKLGTGWLLGAYLERRLRGQRFDACFIHMAHEWTYRLGPWLRLRGIPVLVWYAHGSTSLRLRITERVADAIVTSTSSGFGVPSQKVHVIGQGIDTDLFALRPAQSEATEAVFVGRISPRKRLEVLVEAMVLLRDRHGLVPPVTLRFVGPASSDADVRYRRSLEARVARDGLTESVYFDGHRRQSETAELYDRAFVHVNASATGSMDKTVLEALACGCPVITSNRAFDELLASRPEFRVETDDPELFADRMAQFFEKRSAVDRASIRAMVDGTHDIHSYAERVVDVLESLASRRNRT